MKSKRLLVLAMSAMMVSANVMSAWAAETTTTVDVAFKGADTLIPFTITWMKNPADVDKVEFSTKDGAACSYEATWHGLTVKNLSHAANSGTEVVKVTLANGDVENYMVSFAADGIEGVTDAKTSQYKKDEGTDFNRFYSGDSKKPVSVWLDDIELGTGEWTHTDMGALIIEEESLRGILPGVHTLAINNEGKYTDVYNIEFVADATNSYPGLASDMIVLVSDEKDDVKVNLDLGKGTHATSGVSGIYLGNEKYMDTSQWSVANGQLLISKAALAELGIGYNQVLVEYKDVDAASVLPVYVKKSENPTATPSKAVYNKQYPSSVDFTLDMGKYEFSKIKINGTESEEFMLSGSKLTIKDTYTKTLAVGTYKISVLARTGETFDVATLEVTDVKKNEPQMGEIQNKTLGIDAPWVFPANTMDYTFKSLKIDGNVVAGATYDNEKGQITVPAEEFNAIGEKEVTLSVATEEGQDFTLGKVKPSYVTKGMAVNIAVNPTKYTYNVDSGKGLSITASKSWDNVIWEGRSKDGKKFYSGYAVNVSDGKIPFDDERMKPEAGSELAVLVFDSRNPGQSNPFYVSVVSDGEQSGDENQGNTDTDKVDTSISPKTVTYDKRDKGDVTFTVKFPVERYIISGGPKGSLVLRSGTCTSAVIPEAVLQSLDNGVYEVRFGGEGDGRFTDTAIITITRSGVVSGSTDTVDNSNWSYPGKTLPNRNNALGGGKTSGGSSGSSGSSSSGTSSSSSPSSSQSVTYPSIDLSSLALLVTDHNGWEKQSDGRWKFKDASGNYRASTYLVLSSGSYVIGSDGCMVTGWIVNPNNGQWFYADKTNGDLRDGWQVVDGVWYYLATRDDTTHTWGQMYSNERTPDGYTVNASGAWVQ